MPASPLPMASATATQPSGMASIAPLVERGLAHDSGVARSSRAGTKRSVKAGPTTRSPALAKGFGPRIQVRRRPFFRSTVVSVAVEIARRASARAGVRVMAPIREGSRLP